MQERRKSISTITNITVEEFDRIFDEGKEDILQYFDLCTKCRPSLDPELKSLSPCEIFEVIKKRKEQKDISQD